MDVGTWVSIGTLVAFVVGATLFIAKSREQAAVLRSEIAAHLAADTLQHASFQRELDRLSAQKASTESVESVRQSIDALREHLDSVLTRISEDIRALRAER